MHIRSSRTVLMAALGLLVSCCGALGQSGVTSQTGTLPDGATYLLEVPSNWNGILFLYSHGYVVPGSNNPAHDVGDRKVLYGKVSSF